MDHQQRTPRRGRPIAVLAGCLLAGPAAALVLYFDLGAGQRSITLQVGSADSLVNSVRFDVLGASVAPDAVPVTGVAGGGAPVVGPAGGVLFVITSVRRGGGRDVLRLTANSSAGLACQSGSCVGSGAAIPFGAIDWTSYDPFAGGSSGGIPSGSFNGGPDQAIYSQTIPAPNNSMVLANVLLFRYANTTLYPSGTYSGRVLYTLSVP